MEHPAPSSAGYFYCYRCNNNFLWEWCKCMIKKSQNLFECTAVVLYKLEDIYESCHGEVYLLWIHCFTPHTTGHRWKHWYHLLWTYLSVCKDLRNYYVAQNENKAIYGTFLPTTGQLYCWIRSVMIKYFFFVKTLWRIFEQVSLYTYIQTCISKLLIVF